MTRYLDQEGLAKLWERIQRLVYECGGKGGGGGCTCDNAILYLNETKTEDDHYYYYTLDKSFAEIKDAWEHSKRIVVEIKDDLSKIDNYLVYAVETDDLTEDTVHTVAAYRPLEERSAIEVWTTDTDSTSEHPKRTVAKPN